METVLEKTLEKAWNSTCKVLLGREIGQLKEYRGWLSAHLPKSARRKSHLNGKEVMLAVDAYPKNAQFVSESELEYNKGYGLSINDIKDIDSIIEAMRGKCEYSGNRFLGTSAYVEASDIVLDSQYVNNSTNIEESMYADSSFMIRRNSKYAFGSGYLGQSEFVMRVVGTFNSKRCFECYFVPDSSDMYFSESCFGSRDCLFCFGQRNASYKIGNLQLPKEKYLQLKAKIIGEVASELEKNKSFPTLLEIVGGSKEHAGKLEDSPAQPQGSMAPVEKGFDSTCNVVLKRSIGSIIKYDNWLSENTARISCAKTQFGGKAHYPEKFAYVSTVPEGRLVNYGEMMSIGKTALAPDEVQSLSSIRRAIGKIGYFALELYAGENSNYVASPLVYNATNVYKTYDATYADNVGVCFQALNSKYVYGGYRSLESQFSIKCYNSQHLNRCFELDSCNKCSDSYFCHNSEALQDCMFCFNMKGRRHSVGNTQLEREKYAKVKDALVGQIADELMKTGRLKLNIYNIGAKQ